MEIAQHTQDGALVDDAAALPSPAGVTGAFPSRAYVGNRADVGDGLGLHQIFLARRRALLFRAGGGDGDGCGTWHSRLDSHGRRHIDRVTPERVWQVQDKGASVECSAGPWPQSTGKP